MKASADLLYPWLQGQWQRLQQARDQGRMPHALLLSGPRGVGKGDFARLLARSLLCRQLRESGLPCGECNPCRLFASGGQPDFLEVRPEEEGKVVKVDQIRTLCAELGLKSHGGGFKVALIEPAEGMNVNAANSLLKTLEEPTDNTLLMLISEQPARLMPTIRSRCQQIGFPAPPRQEALEWLAGTEGLARERAELLLELAGGAPLQARALAADQIVEQRAARLGQLQAVQAGRDDPLNVAAEWSKEADAVTLAWLQDWIGDMIRLSLGGDSAPVRNADLRDRLHGMAGRTSPAWLYQRLDQVTAALRMSASGVNRQLLMEDLIVAWAQGPAAGP